MYVKTRNVYSDLNSFTINNKKVFAVKKTNILELNSEILLLLESNNLFQEICNSNNCLFANDIYGNGLIINDNFKQYDGIFIIRIIDNEFFLGEKENKTIKYNYLTNQIVSSIEIRIFKYLYLSEDVIFSKKNSQIEKYSLDQINGALLWQTDISQIGKYIPFLEEEERDGEVDQFVGVWSNELIVLLKGGKFIGIDVETGNINWEQNRVQNNKTSNTIDFNFGEPYHPFLNEEKGMIYILQGEAFIEFDLKTKIATYTWSSLEVTSENYVFIRQSRLFDNKILFSAFRKGKQGHDDTIGIFDIEKKEIIWQYTFDFEKDNFIPNSQNSIQMNDTSVYVLDWKGTLHIFEKL